MADNFLKQFKNDEQGSALIELSIVVMVILLLTTGMLEYGKYFAKAANLSSSAYNAVLIGSEQAPNIQVDETKRIFKDLWGLQWDREREIKLDGYDAYSESSGLNRDMIRLTAKGTVRSKLLRFSMPVKMTVSGAVLRLNPGDTTNGKGIKNTDALVNDYWDGWSQHCGLSDCATFPAHP